MTEDNRAQYGHDSALDKIMREHNAKEEAIAEAGDGEQADTERDYSPDATQLRMIEAEAAMNRLVAESRAEKAVEDFKLDAAASSDDPVDRYLARNHPDLIVDEDETE